MSDSTTTRSPRARFDALWHRDEHGCWLWTGSKTKGGYGRFYLGGKRRVMATHMALLFYRGEVVPKGLYVCHTCDNPSCVNPDHLWMGTLQDNNRDKMAKGRNVSPSGEQHGTAILAESQVVAIREEYAAGGISKRMLSQKYGVSESTIGQVTRGEIWRSARGPITTPDGGKNQYSYAPPTQCKRGHEFTPENTRIYEGRRYCRACGRERYHQTKVRDHLEGRDD